MSRIDESLDFKRLGIAILSISDTRDERTDSSGDKLAELVAAAGHSLIARGIVRDDRNAIREKLREWTATETVNAIVTTGGTGLTGRDITPEAVTPLFDKQIDGFSAIFHSVSYESVGLSTLLARACAGVVGKTFIFCLPGSRGAVTDGWSRVIQPLLDNRHRPCNFSDLIPRLAEHGP